ncbi:MAG: SynChlorMet cassette radical SAM/SPASM protein ScmF [Desulfobacterales bacterium]|nr:SynChlorMet cassette radical SAM/SPASM protein ScmF [Desulfobacterales bacterium]
MPDKNNHAKSIRRPLPPRPACGRYLGCIYFYITEGCNLRCRHCWINPPFESESQPKYPHVDLETFTHIVDQGLELGLAAVKLTGGEPLIHPEIEKVVDAIHSRRLKLNIETNGVALTPGLARRIMAGPERVALSISLDSHQAQTHEWVRGVKGSFAAALRGVKCMTDAGYKPQIIMSVMRRNAGGVEALVELAASMGAGSVKFNPVTPTARGKKLHENGEALSIEELLTLGKFVEDELSSRAGIPLIYAYPAAFRGFGNIKSRPNISGCGIFRSIGVLGNGKYALCGIGESLPEFIFGDARTDSLKDVWNHTPLLNEIREGLPGRLEGVCRDCVMRDGCLGSCIANNYNFYKKLFAPHRYCQTAYEAGLFPKSRLAPGSDHDRNYHPE